MLPTPEQITAVAAVVVPVCGLLWYLIRLEIRGTMGDMKVRVERRFGQIEQRLSRLEGAPPPARAAR